MKSFIFVISFVFCVTDLIGQPCKDISVKAEGTFSSMCDKIVMTAEFDRQSRPFIYIANKDGGLVVLDILDLQSPTEVARLSSDELNGLHVMNLSQQGNLLFLALGNHFSGVEQPGAIAVVNITNPASPILLDLEEVPNSSSGAGIVEVSGNYAYLGAMQSGLAVFDISNSTAIEFVSSLIPNFDYPDGPDRAKVNARGMVISEPYLYLAYDAGGVRTIDISDPHNLKQIFQYSNPALNGYPRAYNNMSIIDDEVFVTFDYCGLEIFNFTPSGELIPKSWWNPWDCTKNFLRWFSSPGHTNEIGIDEDCGLVFMSTGKSDLYVIDVMTQDSCLVYGGLDNNIGTWGLDVFENKIALAYICVPLSVPFPSSRTELKILSYEANCTSSNIEQGIVELKIEPNPVRECIRTNLPIMNYVIYNVNGRLNPCQKIDDKTIDVSKLNAGIYFFISEAGSTTFVKY